MQWVIFIIVLINLFFTLGLVGAMADLKPQKPRNTLDDGKEPEFLADPIPKRKKAVKQTTSLKKRANVAKSQKRANNGRFA